MDLWNLGVVYFLVTSRSSGVWCFQNARYRNTRMGRMLINLRVAEPIHRRQHILLQMFSMDEGENFVDDDFDEITDEELEASMGNWDEKIARFNSIQLTGRVGNTPEARYFDDGKVVVNLSLATQRKYHVMDRQMNNMKVGDEETDWYRLEIWVSCSLHARTNISVK